jgi:transcription initiation factor TFIID subunit 5
MDEEPMDEQLKEFWFPPNWFEIDQPQVMEYLQKKGYSETAQMLRQESSNQPLARAMASPRPQIKTAPPYLEQFTLLRKWTEDVLDIYKAELRRLLWPIFVHCYLGLISEQYVAESRTLFKHEDLFKAEHEADLRILQRITLPEHMLDDNIAKLYQTNKYRLVISEPAYQHLMQFLETREQKGSNVLIRIVENHLDLRHVDRASNDRFSFAAVILRNQVGQDYPDEDEGIPGHMPGNAISSTDPNVGKTLASLKLGKMQMDKDTEADVRAELEDMDLQMPPAPGQDTLVQTHEIVNIKQEDEDDGPTRAEVPYPPSTSRDVAMEVQKIRENRDRLRIESRTGGIGPGVSVCMYTIHNTFDNITCLDFSDDNTLIAAGTSESYIRVWTIDGSAIPDADSNGQPSASHRLIGHSGPVYAVSFAPSATSSNDDSIPDTKWLLSASADSTIRLWSLDLWQNLVVYKGHTGPVWSLQWGPFGHYFVSGGHDKSARIWTTDSVRHRRLLAGHDDDIDVVAWHPNSSYVFTAGSDKTLRMWSLQTGNAMRMFTSHTAVISAVACSPNGKIVASADIDGAIILWDLASGALVKRMRGHGKGGVWSLTWSVESSVLVSGGADATVRVWDVAEKKSETAAGAGAKLDGAKDGASAVSSAAATVSIAGAGKKRAKEAVVSSDQISAFPTKNSPVYRVKFTRMNLVLAGGAYLV